MPHTVLNSLKSAHEVASLSKQDQKQLCEDLRNRINEVVRETGGHLGPNLGAVEIIVACHIAFDLSKDRLVFDVGHQAYPHKLLTGRNASFDSLRQKAGVSGYPHPEESEYDVFRSGHASTAISTSLGILEGFLADPKTAEQKVIALVGDGSLTGGMAFEGLNHAGHLKKNLIVILNDNSMSISPTVGALSNYFNRIRHHKLVKNIGKDVGNVVGKIPRFGKRLLQALHLLERQSRHFINPGQFFIDLGFEYTGPIIADHLDELVECLRLAARSKGPILVHVLTEKGKGYKPEGPEGKSIIGPHALSPGQRKKEEAQKQKLSEPASIPQVEVPKPVPAALSYSAKFAQTLLKLSEANPKIRAITAAMEEGTALDQYRKVFPDRYYDVGICEQHATGFASGLAYTGLRPVFAVYSTFLQRAFDQVFHELILQGKLPVLFCIDRAGLVGDDGPSHHGLYDISYLRLYPNIIVMAPKDGTELEAMMAFGLTQEYTTAIRYPRDTIPTEGTFSHQEPIALGKPEILQEGKTVALFAYGALVKNALEATKKLQAEGFTVTLVNARFAKPIDPESVKAIAKRHKAIITVEEGTIAGGYGSALLETLSDAKALPEKFLRLAVPDRLIEHASRADQLKECGLDAQNIYLQAKALYEEFK